LELTFPLALWRRGLRPLYLAGAVALHAGIGLTMHLDYSAWALTVVVLFVDWPRWFARGRAATEIADDPMASALVRAQSA
jgi:hypothetical protein